MNSLFGTWAMLLIVLDVAAVHAMQPHRSQQQIEVHSTSIHTPQRSTSLETEEQAMARETSTASSRLMRKESHLSAGSQDPPAAKVDIDVYFETRCPGCLLFLNKTLEPLWRNKTVRDLFKINMYTYGNGASVAVANISEGYKFWHPESTGKGWNTV